MWREDTYHGARRAVFVGEEVGDIEMRDRCLDALRQQVVHAEMAVRAHEEVAIVEREHAIAYQSLEMTTRHEQATGLHVVAHLDRRLRHVVDQSEALVVHGNDVLRGDRRIAGVA